MLTERDGLDIKAGNERLLQVYAKVCSDFRLSNLSPAQPESFQLLKEVSVGCKSSHVSDKRRDLEPL